MSATVLVRTGVQWAEDTHGVPAAEWTGMLGAGCYREVYALDDERYVLKIATGMHARTSRAAGWCTWCAEIDPHAERIYGRYPCSNAVEALVYATCAGTPAERHVPKVYGLSPDHTYVLAERVISDSWGDQPRHTVVRAFQEAGWDPWDDESYNCGRRWRQGDPVSDSVVLDTGNFIPRAYLNLIDLLTGCKFPER